MNFECACSEIDYILKHLAPEDRKKIPDSVFEFFKKNKSIFYKVNLNECIPLKEQELMEETKAFLKILYYKYFAEDSKKKKFIEYIQDEDFINNEDKLDINFDKKQINDTKMVISGENKLLILLKKLFGFFKNK